jgi:hypothetical protein
LSRSTIEPTWTLDDLFGPDLEAELDSMRATLGRMLDDISELDGQARWTTRTLLAGQACDKPAKIAELLRHVGALVESLRADPPLKAHPFRMFRMWVREIRRGLYGRVLRFPDGMLEILDRMPEPRARLAMLRQILREVVRQIDSVLALGRRKTALAALQAVIRSFRDLVGSLLSPHVLAGGGGSGCFVLRI